MNTAPGHSKAHKGRSFACLQLVVGGSADKAPIAKIHPMSDNGSFHNRNYRKGTSDDAQ